MDYTLLYSGKARVSKAQAIRMPTELACLPSTKGSLSQLIISWQLASQREELVVLASLLAFIPWSLWLVRCQSLFPLANKAVQTMVELVSNMSIIFPLKNTSFVGLVSQNLHAPIRVVQATLSRVVALFWLRDFMGVKLSVDGFSFGNLGQSQGDGIA
ncbi:hypothetical protein ACH5RR_008648 [Cinchona calisaya]|uniref:Uncharacterized protein n=1 Tax=Cinchona calisaya TaxID=153742 RepID=A0ABD3AC29_9GENT